MSGNAGLVRVNKATIVSNGAGGLIIFAADAPEITDNLDSGTMWVRTSDANAYRLYPITPSVRMWVQTGKHAVEKVFANITIDNVEYTDITYALISEEYTQVDGSITVQASGGVGDLTYTLLPDNISNSTGMFTISQAGEYTVRVSQSNGFDTKETDVIEIIEVIIPVNAEVTITHETILGANDGTITVFNETGGSGEYLYWFSRDLGGGSSESTGFQDSNVHANAIPGLYTVIIRDKYDSTNITVLGEYTVEEGVPEWMTWFVFVEEGLIEEGNTDTITINGNDYIHADLVNNDYPDILVKYDNESPHHIRMYGLLLPELVNNLTQNQLDTLHEVFDLWVWWSGDWNDYGVFKENRSIEGPPHPVTADYNFTQITAIGANDGTITFSNPANGSGNYEYSINNGLNWQVSPEFTGLGEGSYILRVRDSENTSNDVVLGTVELIEPTTTLTNIELTTDIELETEIII